MAIVGWSLVEAFKGKDFLHTAKGFYDAWYSEGPGMSM